jgi:hypothetical protein
MKFSFPVVFLRPWRSCRPSLPVLFDWRDYHQRDGCDKTPGTESYFQPNSATMPSACDAENTHALTSSRFQNPQNPCGIVAIHLSINGYVTWAPLRMELVATPPQDSYAEDWISQLSLHEYRHAVQISQLDQGFTGALSVLSGEIGPGGISSLVPSWFYEGDAVANETWNSQSGRGRVPGFEMPLRTLLLSDKGVFI